MPVTDLVSWRVYYFSPVNFTCRGIRGKVGERERRKEVGRETRRVKEENGKQRERREGGG